MALATFGSSEYKLAGASASGNANRRLRNVQPTFHLVAHECPAPRLEEPAKPRTRAAISSAAVSSAK